LSENTTESFRFKIMRMFLPVNAKSLDKKTSAIVDLDIIDPLERFEKSILKDSESKKDSRNNSTQKTNI